VRAELAGGDFRGWKRAMPAAELKLAEVGETEAPDVGPLELLAADVLVDAKIPSNLVPFGAGLLVLCEVFLCDLCDLCGLCV